MFIEVCKIAKNKIDAKMIWKRLNIIYVKYALIAIKRIIEEGDSISDIPEFGSLSLRN